jgi:hypothetical protein
MATRSPRRRKAEKRQLHRQLALFEELGANGFSRAFHSHVEELAYERLKDPEYQRWMHDWLDGFLSAVLRGLRARGRPRRRSVPLRRMK